MIEKVSFSRIVFNILNYGFMILLCIACVAPLWHVLMSSVSDPRALMAAKGLLLKPLGDITWKGYQLVFKNANIITGYMNTLFYVAITTILGTTLTVLAGYTISRENMKLKAPITIMILFTMMFSGGLIPTYMIIKMLGMINHSVAVIIPGVINAFYIIMMKSAFEQLPNSYEESAKIDGAGPLTIMIKILVPLIKSTIAVIVMFNIVQQWNSWFPASIYLTKRRDLWPLQLFMREILVQNDTGKILSGSDALSKADYTTNLVKYCVTIVGTLPILCIYPFVQKYFVKGVTLGGVKG
ncbi:MAG TPA: carbohydrate ABC transporter permease [Clostridiales bacterium]|nr:carbohydrate ABC transporter permease [Clostridiales bacterium]